MSVFLFLLFPFFPHLICFFTYCFIYSFMFYSAIVSKLLNLPLMYFSSLFSSYTLSFSLTRLFQSFLVSFFFFVLISASLYLFFFFWQCKYECACNVFSITFFILHCIIFSLLLACFIPFLFLFLVLISASFYLFTILFCLSNISKFLNLALFSAPHFIIYFLSLTRRVLFFFLFPLLGVQLACSAQGIGCPASPSLLSPALERVGVSRGKAAGM